MVVKQGFKQLFTSQVGIVFEFFCFFFFKLVFCAIVQAAQELKVLSSYFILNL